jgi:hypothetical protein
MVPECVREIWIFHEAVKRNICEWIVGGFAEAEAGQVDSGLTTEAHSSQAQK